MADWTYVYSVAINTTAEKLWEALTSNDWWQKYWGGEWRIESEWRAGSPVTFRTGNGQPFSVGQVLEADPPHTLCYTWPNPEHEQGAAPPERLLWKITSHGPGGVMLTLIHDRLAEENYQGVSRGWPVVLNNLKGLLETSSGAQ
jgi:uncharacterized protein YndB with AHSA1/START domain